MDRWQISHKEPEAPVWHFAQAENVSEEDVESMFGDPVVVEDDATRTLGGIEKWWTFESFEPETLLVCYSVPYELVRLFSSSPEGVRFNELPMKLRSLNIRYLEVPQRW